VRLESHNSAAVLAFSAADGYPRLTRDVLGETSELLESIRREGIFRGVVIASDAGLFAAGAELGEIVELEGLPARAFAQLGQRVFNEIEQFPFPIVAAIRGYCLGGGLDLALACHARVATYDACFGHPGASLGLITGWGGTQRLPRLVGKAAALQMLLTGERVPATQALHMGLVDELVSCGDLIETGARRAVELSAQGRWAPVAGSR